MTSKTINNNSTNHYINQNAQKSTTQTFMKSNSKLLVSALLFSFSGFFIGRVNIFNTLNPVAIAFLGTLLFSKHIFYLSLITTFLGFYTKASSFYISKYIICMLFIFIGNIIFMNKYKHYYKKNYDKNFEYNKNVKHNKIYNVYNNNKTKSIICTGSIFISGIFIAIYNNFSLYYFIVAVLEALLTFCLYYILNIGIRVFIKYPTLNTLKTLTNEQVISLAILSACILYGSAYINIHNFNTFSFTYFLSFLLLLVITYIYGSNTGGVVAILSFCLLNINNIIDTHFLIIFTIGSCISGLFTHKSKLVYTIIFNISILVTSIIINLQDFNNINNIINFELQYINSMLSVIYSLFFSSAVFLVLPITNNNNFEVNIINNKNNKNNKNNNINQNPVALSHSQKLQMLTTDRLIQYSNSFEKLSKTFSNLAEKKSCLEQQDISNLIDEVVCKVCKNCDIRVFCWEKNFYDTYQKVFNILDDANFNNICIKNYDNYPNFVNNCVNGELFIDVLSKDFEIYKLNLSWKNKVIESRELVGKQLTGVSNMMMQLSTSLCQDVYFIEKLETKIYKHLRENKIKIKNVIVMQNQNQKLEVLLKVEPCYIPNTCTKSIIPLVNSVVNKKMYRDTYDCIITKDINNNSICTIRLIEEQNYRINTYAISIAKDGSTECGDSHSFLNLPSGGYLLALSDGMGSGASAKAESKATIELLEDFMMSGFSRDLAINMINSALFFKSSKETFATLDICSIDLYTGLCEFIKIGAVSTFILHENNLNKNNNLKNNNLKNNMYDVEVIEMASLPVGILDTIEADVTRKKLYSGDIIIMVTDGVTDSYLTDDYSDYVNLSSNILHKNKDKEKWLINLLEQNKSKNPEDIAQAIVEKVKENYKNKNVKNKFKNIKPTKTKSIINDDITVMVSRIWK